MKKAEKHLIFAGIFTAGFILGIAFRNREAPEYSGSWKKAAGDMDLKNYFTDDFLAKGLGGEADEDSPARA